jgi:dissimilatory sulfite reductase (desulfoviridin) alpha/beta subunit
MNQSNVKKELKKSLTILVSAGVVPAAIQKKVFELTQKYNLGLYLSTAQNIRLLNIEDNDEPAIRDELQSAGAQLKGPGKFPRPRVCVGEKYCNLGIIDTLSLSEKIMAYFEDQDPVKPKFKIAIAGCPALCSNSLLTDIGIKATRSGYELFVGGKGGPSPKIGRRIARGMDEEKLLEMMKEVVDLHTMKAGKKMRMAKLLNDPEFPFAEV